MFATKRLLPLTILASMILLLAACQTPRQASRPPTAQATKAVLPTSTSSQPIAMGTTAPTPTKSQPSPTPRLVPFPPLPPNAKLVWKSPPLPSLHGKLDNAKLMRQVLQLKMRFADDLWVAAWPENFPAEMPLPKTGWLVLALREPEPLSNGWVLYLDIPQKAEDWQKAYEDLLKQNGWTQAPGEGGMLSKPWPEKQWCSPSKKQIISLFITSLDSQHAIANLSYGPAVFSNPCNQPSMVLSPPKDLPTLRPPKGTHPLMGKSISGSPDEWISKRRFSSPQGIQVLVDGFSQQLRAQGWQIGKQVQAQSPTGEAAIITATKKSATLPTLSIFIVGKAPIFDVWLWDGKPKSQPVVPQHTTLPILHGRLNDVHALRRALALAFWQEELSQPPEVWVGAEPTPWPQPLPKPSQATWLSAQHVVYLSDSGKGNGDAWWEMVFTLPQSIQQAKDTLNQALLTAGWKAVSPRDMGPHDVGFMPRMIDKERLSMYCHQGSMALIANYTKERPEQTQVRWSFSTTSNVCRSGGGWVDSGDLPKNAPVVQLFLEADNQPLGGGVNLIGARDFSQGYTTYANWWSNRAPATQGKSFAEQLAARHWQIVHQTALGDVGYWVQATYRDANGKTWQADVLIGTISKGYMEGVIRVLPVNP